MKNLVTLILCCLALQTVTAQIEVSTVSLHQMDIKGPAKEVIEYTYTGGLNETSVDTLKKPSKKITDFDVNGNKAAEVFLSSKGALITKYVFDYHEKNKISVSQFDDNSQLTRTFVINYDDKHLALGCDMYLPKYETAVFKSVYNYDSNNNRIEEDVYAGSNQLTKILFFYDDKNRKIKDETYDPRGKLFSISKFSYNALDELVKIENDSDSLGTKDDTTNKYQKKDKYGNWLLQISAKNGNMPLLGKMVSKGIIKRSIKYY